MEWRLSLESTTKIAEETNRRYEHMSRISRSTFITVRQQLEQTSYPLVKRTSYESDFEGKEIEPRSVGAVIDLN
jgi:hypothetical protein